MSQQKLAEEKETCHFRSDTSDSLLIFDIDDTFMRTFDIDFSTRARRSVFLEPRRWKEDEYWPGETLSVWPHAVYVAQAQAKKLVFHRDTDILLRFAVTSDSRIAIATAASNDHAMLFVDHLVCRGISLLVIFNCFTLQRSVLMKMASFAMSEADSVKFAADVIPDQLVCIFSRNQKKYSDITDKFERAYGRPPRFVFQ